MIGELTCIANAYTNNHEELQSDDISSPRWLALHAIDTIGLVHAMILRIQALLLPMQTLDPGPGRALSGRGLHMDRQSNSVKSDSLLAAF